MAELEATATGERVPLPAECLIGRSLTCVIRLDRPDVSNEHASLRWSGSGWELRDLGSRNGTYVEGVRLGPGEATRLTRDAAVQFGRDGGAWRLVNDDPPELAVFELRTGTWWRAQGNVLGLPDDDEPLITVLHVAEGGWIAQSATDVRPVRDGEILVLGEQRWRLHLPRVVAPTENHTADAAPPELAGPQLSFLVSRDEEHVELRVSLPGQPERSLGARAHHYLLLVLARLRARDAKQAELPTAEHGWVHLDELGSMLNLDRSHLYVMVHRARRHLAGCGIPEAARIVEFRPRTGMVRLGFRHFVCTGALEQSP